MKKEKFWKTTKDWRQLFLHFISRKFLIFISLLLSSFLLSSSLTHAQTPIFSESFDSLTEIAANGGTASNVNLEAGKSGQGALITGNASLVYPAANRFNFQKGTIEFWVKPKWDGTIVPLDKTKNLLTISLSSGFWDYNLAVPIYAYGDQNTLEPTFTYRSKHDETFLQDTLDIMKWKPNEWHKVTLFWDFSLADNTDGTHNSYLVAKIDDVYTELKNVTPVGTDAYSSDAYIIIGQERKDVVGRGPADAVFDELKIYDTSLLPVIPFPQYQYNPWYQATETTFRKLFANDSFCSPFENYNNDPSECSKLADSIKSGESTLFFQKPAFEQVYENYVPQESEIKTNFNYQAAKGAYEDLFFNMYSRTNLNNVKVTYTDFQGDHGTISKDNLDLRVVKNWFQAAGRGATVADQLPVYVPELMLHNDQIPLETDTTLSASKLPSLPVLDHAETKITQYTSRQFVMIAKVPDNAAAGTYTSTVRLSADGIPDQTITLSLEVLPFALKNTGKTYGMWRGCNDDSDITLKELKDIKNHGFNQVQYIGCWTITFGELTKLVQKTKEAGLSKVMLYVGVNPSTYAQDITAAQRDLMTQNGFEPWFYGIDEVGTGNLADQVKKSMVIHSLGAKVITDSYKDIMDALADPNNSVYDSFPSGTYEPTDWAEYPNYGPSGTYFAKLMAGQVQKTPNRLESVWWEARDENPYNDRYFCGYFPWNTGIDGAVEFLYQGGGSKDQFYNDFDWTGPDRRFRPYTLTYPSQEGPVPTMQWEASKEGINDAKYIATWKYYKDEVAKTSPSTAQQSETVVNAILARYKDTRVTANPAGYRNSMSQYAADRKTIISEILKLKQSANPSNADLNSDNFVNQTDLDILKADFLKLTGSLSNPKSDIDGDGTVTIKDVGIMMSEWK